MFYIIYNFLERLLILKINKQEQKIESVNLSLIHKKKLILIYIYIYYLHLLILIINYK